MRELHQGLAKVRAKANHHLLGWKKIAEDAKSAVKRMEAFLREIDRRENMLTAMERADLGSKSVSQIMEDWETQEMPGSTEKDHSGPDVPDSTLLTRWTSDDGACVLDIENSEVPKPPTSASARELIDYILLLDVEQRADVRSVKGLTPTQVNDAIASLLGRKLEMKLAAKRLSYLVIHHEVIKTDGRYRLPYNKVERDELK